MLDTRHDEFSSARPVLQNRVPSDLNSPRYDEPLSLVLGRRLRWIRVERSMSRKQVAERVGVPVGHIEGHEHGVRPLPEAAPWATLW